MFATNDTDVLNCAEAAAFMRMSLSRFRSQIAKKIGRKVGRQWLFHKPKLIRYLNSEGEYANNQTEFKGVKGVEKLCQSSKGRIRRTGTLASNYSASQCMNRLEQLQKLTRKNMKKNDAGT